jgi:hypothetical protein
MSGGPSPTAPVCSYAEDLPSRAGQTVAYLVENQVSRTATYHVKLIRLWDHFQPGERTLIARMQSLQPPCPCQPHAQFHYGLVLYILNGKDRRSRWIAVFCPVETISDYSPIRAVVSAPCVATPREVGGLYEARRTVSWTPMPRGWI